MREMGNTIIYRVDGNHSIGLGHIFRARSLCKELKARKIRPVILTTSASYLVDEMISWGVEVHSLSDELCPADTIISFARSLETRILIQDIRDTGLDYARQLKKNGLVLINFDDLGNGADYVDVLIDANIPEHEQVVSKYRTTLFGRKYMVLDPVFGKFNKMSRSVSDKVKNIVVSMGGSDPRNLTGWVVKILSGILNECRVRIVVGKGTDDKQLIRELCAKAGFEYIHNTDNMARLLYEADMAVISGGITLYESVCAGCPAVVIPQVEHQYTIAKRFEDCGIAKCAMTETQLDSDMFKNAFISLMNNPDLRKRMSRTGRSFVDGKGAGRIADTIQNIFQIQYERNRHVFLR